MKTQLLTLLLAAGIAISSSAQSKSDSLSTANRHTRLSIGVDAGIPVGDVSEVYNFVLGGSARVEVPTIQDTYLTVTAGYSAFFIKSFLKDAGAPSTSGFVPLKAGLKIYTSSNFFVEGQAGIVWSTEDGGGHAFAWSPGLGYSFDKGFELSARYEGWSNGGTVGQISARIAYRF